jgi:hypothetical protein
MLILADPDFVSIEWQSAHIHPRLILFTCLDLPGHEQRFLYKFLVLRFTDGISFVLDLSAWQYGLDKVLWTLDEYRREVIDQNERRFSEDPEKWIKLKVTSYEARLF